MAVGDSFIGNIRSFTDPETGYTVYKPIERDQNRHMYFTSNPFTKSGTHVVFSGTRDGQENFYLLNYITGEYVQLTDIPGLKMETAYYDKAKDTLYYGNERTVYSVHVRSLAGRKIYESEIPIGSIGVTCDGRYLVTSVAGVKKMLNNDKQELDIPMWRMLKVDLDTLEESTILIRSTKFDHIQCNPTDPDMIMYCLWGYYCTHQRIWYCNLTGTKGGPLGPEMPNEHRTHEYFTSDGNRVAYHGKFFETDDRFNFKNFRHTWGIMDKYGVNDKWYTCLPSGNQAGHSIISHNGKMIAADGNNWISFVKPDDESQTAIFEPVVRHNSSMKGNYAHPHPSFSMDDRFIIYVTDNGGTDNGNIYLVDLQSRQ